MPPLGHFLDDIPTQCCSSEYYEIPHNLCIFGGSDGQYLSQLTSIRAWFGFTGNVQGLEFTYSSEINGSFNHRWGFIDHQWPLSTLHNSGKSKLKQDFAIDGAGGERICRVEVMANLTWTSTNHDPPTIKQVSSLKVMCFWILMA